MMGLPNWLRQDSGDFDMTHDEEMTIPKIARIEPKVGVRGGYQAPGDAPKPAAPTTGSGVEVRPEQRFVDPRGQVHPQAENSIPPVERDEAVAKAAAAFVVNQREQQQHIDRLVADKEILRRKLVDTELKLLEETTRANNNETKAEDLRQENADLRAGGAEALATLKHVVIRMENNGILPPRKRGNGNTKQKALQETTTKTLQEEIKRDI